MTMIASPETPMLSVITGPTLMATRSWIRAASWYARLCSSSAAGSSLCRCSMTCGGYARRNNGQQAVASVIPRPHIGQLLQGRVRHAEQRFPDHAAILIGARMRPEPGYVAEDDRAVLPVQRLRALRRPLGEGGQSPAVASPAGKPAKASSPYRAGSSVRRYWN